MLGGKGNCIEVARRNPCLPDWTTNLIFAAMGVYHNSFPLMEHDLLDGSPSAIFLGIGILFVAWTTNNFVADPRHSTTGTIFERPPEGRGIKLQQIKNKNVF